MSAHQCLLHSSGSQRISNSGEPLYTPAARGIHTPLEVDGDVLLSLCLRSLPRGTLEFLHELIGLQEDRDGMALSFQVKSVYTLPHQVELEGTFLSQSACCGFCQLLSMSLS